MGSNHSTLRVVAAIHIVIGVIVTIVGSVFSFLANPILGILVFLVCTFMTVSSTCLYYGVANIQENQMRIAESLEKKLGLEIEQDEED